MHPRLLLLLPLLVASALSAAEPRVFLGPGEAERLERYLNYLSLPRLTEKPIDMVLVARKQCRILDPKWDNKPHTKPGIHLYANDRALARPAAAPFPVGSLIVKEKFEERDDASPSLITVMEKTKDRGRVDDWQFMMVRLADRSIVRETPEVSCVECHARYTRTDFVSHTTFRLLVDYAGKPLTGKYPATPARAEIPIEGVVARVVKNGPYLALPDARGITRDVAVVTITQPSEFARREVCIAYSDHDRAFWEQAKQRSVTFAMDGGMFEQWKADLQDDRPAKAFETYWLQKAKLKSESDVKPPARTP